MIQCIQEVTANESIFHQSQLIPALDHGVYKSDTIIPHALMVTLQGSLIRLERLSKRNLGDNPTGPEFSIVDPCQYPLVFGLTKYYSSAMSNLESCIRLSGRGMSNRSLLAPDVNGSLNGTYQIENAWSTKYQWLPCDISFDEQTGKAQYAASNSPTWFSAHSRLN